METENRVWISPGVIVGLMIVIVGVVLLLDQNGVISIGGIFRLWPTLLVTMGLIKLTERPAAGRTFGLLLLCVGAVLQLDELGYLHIHIFNLWPLLLIFFGVTLLHRALSNSCPRTAAASLNAVGESAFFGGGERRLTTEAFEGGHLLAVFGGYKLDLTAAQLQDHQASLEATAIFGGIEVIVPREWRVTMRGTGMFGGFTDETRSIKPPEGVVQNHLIVTGGAIFGGVTVKN